MKHQAVAWRFEWERLWAVLEDPWQTQRAVYRKVRGGKFAPVLCTNVKPSFRPWLQQGAAELPAREKSLSVARTFVHFTEDECQGPRSGSQPPPRLAEPPPGLSDPIYIDLRPVAAF